MATPIKQMPVLLGQDGGRSEADMRKAGQASVNREVYARMQSVFRSERIVEKSGSFCGATGKGRSRAYAHVRSGIKKAIAMKAVRKMSLFAGIYQSEQFTIDAAYKAFAGLGSKKRV